MKGIVGGGPREFCKATLWLQKLLREQKEPSKMCYVEVAARKELHTTPEPGTGQLNIDLQCTETEPDKCPYLPCPMDRWGRGQ